MSLPSSYCEQSGEAGRATNAAQNLPWCPNLASSPTFLALPVFPVFPSVPEHRAPAIQSTEGLFPPRRSVTWGFLSRPNPNPLNIRIPADRSVVFQNLLNVLAPPSPSPTHTRMVLRTAAAHFSALESWSLRRPAEPQLGFLTARGWRGWLLEVRTLQPGAAPACCPHTAFPVSAYMDAGPGGLGSPPWPHPNLPSRSPVCNAATRGWGLQPPDCGDCNQHRWRQEGADTVGRRWRGSGGSELNT